MSLCALEWHDWYVSPDQTGCVASAAQTNDKKRRKSVYVGDVHAMPCHAIACGVLKWIQISRITYVNVVSSNGPCISFSLVYALRWLYSVTLLAMRYGALFIQYTRFCRARTPLLTLSLSLSLCPPLSIDLPVHFVRSINLSDSCVCARVYAWVYEWFDQIAWVCTYFDLFMCHFT